MIVAKVTYKGELCDYVILKNYEELNSLRQDLKDWCLKTKGKQDMFSYMSAKHNSQVPPYDSVRTLDELEEYMQNHEEQEIMIRLIKVEEI